MSIERALSSMSSALFKALKDITRTITITEMSRTWDSVSDRYVVTSSSPHSVEAIVVGQEEPDDDGRRALVAYIKHDTPVSISPSITVVIDGVDYNVVDGNWAHKLPTEPFKLVLKSGG